MVEALGTVNEQDKEKQRDFFALYSRLSRGAMVTAQGEARSMGSRYIGTQHLLLGLLRAEGSVAQKALTTLDLTVEDGRSRAGRMLGDGAGREGRDPSPEGQLPFTPRTKQVLVQAQLEARWLEHDKHLGPEHLLLGLAGEYEGGAAQILNARGATPGKVRRELMRRIRRGYTPEYLARYGDAKEALDPESPQGGE